VLCSAGLWAASKRWKKLTLNRLSTCRWGELATPPRAGEDGMAYRLGEDRWGFIAVETGMGKAEVDWL